MNGERWRTVTGCAVACATATGCTGNLVPEWQLAHDHIIGVRATPPHVASGSAAVLDGLIAHDVGPPTDDAPLLAMLGSGAPPALVAANVVQPGSAGGWQVIAPDPTTLDAARGELGIAAGSAVPIAVVTAFGSATAPLVAIKTVTLGDTGDNPTLGAVTVGGAAVAATTAIVVPETIDVALAIDEPDADQVDWLTSCGTLTDDAEHDAILDVAPTDPQTGQLAVVLRTPDFGIAWQVWAISASGSGG